MPTLVLQALLLHLEHNKKESVETSSDMTIYQNQSFAQSTAKSLLSLLRDSLINMLNSGVQCCIYAAFFRVKDSWSRLGDDRKV